MYASMGTSVVRVSKEGRATVIAGHPWQPDHHNGTGLAAGCRQLTSDGEGCLYILDDGMIRRLQLPAAWRRSAPTQRTSHGTQQQQQQAGGHAQDLTSGEAVVTTIACGAHIDWRLLSVAYDPTSRSLVLCTCSAVYRLPLEGLGAAAPKTVHQLELVAGAEGEDGHLDGVGALFNNIWAVAVDGTGTAWVLDYLAKHPSDEQPDSSAQGGPGRCLAAACGPQRPRRDGAHGAAGVAHAQVRQCRRTAGWLPGDGGVCHTDSPAAAAGPDAALGWCHRPRPRHPVLRPGRAAGPPAGRQRGRGGGGGRAGVRRTPRRAGGAQPRQRLGPGAGFADGRAPRLSLPDADPAAFGAVLRFMYTDSAGPVAPDLLQPVGELADRLLLPGLCAQVGSQLLGRVCAESVVGLLLWAEQRSGSFGALLGGLKEWFLGCNQCKGDGAVPEEEVLRLMRDNPRLALQLLHTASRMGQSRSGGEWSERSAVRAGPRCA